MSYREMQSRPAAGLADEGALAASAENLDQGRDWLGLLGGRLLPWISSIVVLALMYGGWKLAIAWFNISPFILPQPERVAHGMVKLEGSIGFWGHVGATLEATLVGFGIGLGFGVVAGVVLGRVVWLERALRPAIVASQVVPKVALVPMFIIWFGFGITSKIITAAMLAFFPIMLNVILGVRSVDAGHRDVMRSLNASRWSTFWRLEFHSTLPYVLAGTEIGIVFAIIGAILGEYLGGSKGLGFLVVQSLNNLNAEVLFAVIVVLTVLGLLLFLAVVALKRFLIPWHESVLRSDATS
jgi:NitT/TauT family transport system permease protein